MPVTGLFRLYRWRMFPGSALFTRLTKRVHLRARGRTGKKEAGVLWWLSPGKQHARQGSHFLWLTLAQLWTQDHCSWGVLLSSKPQQSPVGVQPLPAVKSCTGLQPRQRPSLTQDCHKQPY